MKLDFTEAAREFCRDHQCNNVGLIHQAMLKGAEIAIEAATKHNKIAADLLEEQRKRNLSGGHSR